MQHGPAHLSGPRALLALLVGALLTLGLLPLPASAVPDGTGDETIGGQLGSESLASPQQARPVSRSEQSAELTLKKLTAVITSSSGWETEVTIRNTSSGTLPAGTLTAFLSPYSIQSATTAQSWADGKSVFRAPLVLDSRDVAPLKSGASRTIRLSAAKDAQTLQAIRTWGAKPVLLDYSTDTNGTVARLRTFSTRSHDGLTDGSNPPITLTFALPFASDGWQARTSSVSRLVTSSTATAQVASLPAKQVTRLRRLAQIAQKNSAVQVVADPATFALVRQGAATGTSSSSSSPSPKSSGSVSSSDSSGSKSTAPSGSSGSSDSPASGAAKGSAGATGTSSAAVSLPLPRLQAMTQPYMFDIPASLAFGTGTWKAAGITNSDWSALAGRSLLAGTDTSFSGTPATQSFSEQSQSSSGQSNGKSSAQSGADSGQNSDKNGSSQNSNQNNSNSQSGTSNQSSANSQNNSGNQSAVSTQAVAWESAEAWSTSSLAAALSNGYQTVVAESALPTADGANQQTGRIRVSTEKGVVTVLIAQHELSSLAAGSRTSDQAQAEDSNAGRLARLAAQSSIYEAEQPYVARNLLVSLGRTADPALLSQILALLPSCDWIHTGTLADLEAGKTGTDLDKTGLQEVDSSAFSLTGDRENGSTLSGTVSATRNDVNPRVRRSSLKKALATLAGARSSIDRVSTSILDPKDQKEKDDNGKTDNPQNLAKQNAQEAAENHVTADEWIDKLRQAHRQLALLAVTSKYPDTSSETLAAQDLSDDLLGAVRLTTPDHINIFSQSARMPVTVTNTLPFAVRVGVKAQTSLMATTITPSQPVHVLANAESQANFTIRVIGASQTTATFRLVDNKGKAFGMAKSAAIYSQLSLGDTSGYLLIAIAVVLGILGLWRQFHVKKDPDQ